MTITYTTSLTFTRTHAAYLASKIAADFRQMQRFYGQPSDAKIEAYIEELVELLRQGYLQSVDYGFWRDSKWLIALRYEVRTDGTMVRDDRSGRVAPNADVSGANWYSYLRKSHVFWDLPANEREKIEQSLPIQRTAGEEPQTGNGVWIVDKSYEKNGIGIQRHTFQPY